MSLDAHTTEPCVGCELTVFLNMDHHVDEYDEVWHPGCWENHETSQAERAFERSLNADNGPSDLLYRADMIDAGRGRLLR